MKIVKLNNRYKLFKLGYTHAVMATPGANHWAEMRQLEKAAQATLGDQYIRWNTHSRESNGPWVTGYLKKRSSDETSRYYIAVRREQDLSMIMLRMQMA